MDKIKKFVKENRFLSISLLLLFITLIIIAVAYIPNRNETGIDSSDATEKDEHSKLPSELDAVGQSAKYTKVKDTYCPAFEGVVYATNTKFITEIEGKYYLYEYVLDKKYSDETNCHLIEELEKKPKMFTYDRVFWGNNQSILTEGDFIIYEDLSYALMSSPNKYNRRKVYSSYYEKGTPLEDGSYIIEYPSYSYEIVKWNKSTDSFQIKNEFLDTSRYGWQWEVTKYAVVYSTSISHDIFLELTIDNPLKKYLNGAIATHRAIYTWGLFDDSCLTYVDVECEFGFVKNLDFTERYDDILFVNRQYVVFKDGTTYLYQNL